MDNKELHTLTASFPNIAELLNKQNKLHREISSVRRKLKTQFKKYEFLQGIVGQTSGTLLELLIIKCFNEMGFKPHKPKGKDEDIQLLFENRLIIVEVTGIGGMPNQNKAHQISKHIPIKQQQHPEKSVTGLFIVNHENTKHYTARNRNPFDIAINNIAASHQYSLMSTVDLLNCFLLLKTGQITLEQIIGIWCKGGIVKIL